MTATIFIDQFGPVTDAEAAQLVANGVSGVNRYLGYYTHPAWAKGCSVEEVAIIHSHGLGVGLNWEADPVNAANIQPSNGQSDGADIVTEVDNLNAPSTVGVWCSIDFNIPQTDFPLALSYFQALYKEVGTRVKLGVYAKYTLLQFLKQEAPFLAYFWEPAAWSNGVVLPWINQYQARYDVRMASHSVDVDNMHNLYGIWMPTPQKPTVPKFNVITGWFDEAEATTFCDEVQTKYHYHSWVQQVK